MAASAMRSTEPPHTSTTGGPWPSRSNASFVPSFEVTVSIQTSSSNEGNTFTSQSRHTSPVFA